MILRSFPITDFSPVEGALIDDSAPLLLLGCAVRSGFGAADELRVNMKSPNENRLALQAPHRNMIPTVPATKTRQSVAQRLRAPIARSVHWSSAGCAAEHQFTLHKNPWASVPDCRFQRTPMTSRTAVGQGACRTGLGASVPMRLSDQMVVICESTLLTSSDDPAVGEARSV